MNLASCERDGRAFAARVEGDELVVLDGIAELAPETLLDALAADGAGGERVPLAGTRLRPVIPNPRKVVCVGLNYRPHVAETARELPDYPVLFTKFARTLCGPNDDIVLPPAAASTVDWEGEVAVIIGAPGRAIAKADALDHVAGYAVANDISMREYQQKSHQWLQGKCWEASTPLGPWLTTGDAIDPYNLRLRTLVGDEVVQDASTADLIFDVPTLIAELSLLVTLEPGDVILTGTPGGVGMARDPQRYLAPGERVAVEVDGLGRIESAVVAG